MSWSTSELRVRLAPLNRFKPSSKIFYWPFQGGTSFVDLLCFCSVLCLLCFVRVCLYVLCGHLLGKGWPLGSRLWCLLWVCHFPIGILGQVWYLIVSIPDLCTLTYFKQGYRYHINFAKPFLNFIIDTIIWYLNSKLDLNLSSAKDFRNLNSMVTWCINWIRLLTLIIFQRSLLKKCHYKKIGYTINVLQQTACLVINPNMVDNLAFLLKPTPSGRISDSLTVRT